MLRGPSQNYDDDVGWADLIQLGFSECAMFPLDGGVAMSAAERLEVLNWVHAALCLERRCAAMHGEHYVPHVRIVPDDVWLRVQEMRRKVSAKPHEVHPSFTDRGRDVGLAVKAQEREQRRGGTWIGDILHELGYIA